VSNTVLVICPHADDGAIFCGGQIIRFVQAGWNVVLVRVTDDRTDSMNLSFEETIRINTEQFHMAAALLGAQTIVELGYATDCLGDVSRVELRERFIRLFRQHRPYAVLSFDPYATFEPNLDHIVVAQAVEEAYWTATFDKHHPEHLKEGLLPHSVCERWYFARQLSRINCVINISAVLEQKIAAVAAHTEMIRNTINQSRLQLRTWGRYVPAIDHAVDSGSVEEYVRLWLERRAGAWGSKYGIPFAEVYRVDRFGTWDDYYQRESLPLPDQEGFHLGSISISTAGDEMIWLND
jgi:LmbE family N-acetylglucosaminyl deacetylase